MKRLSICCAVLLLGGVVVAQQPGAPTQTPSSPPAAGSGTEKPAAAPAGKTAPQAKSQPEFDAYKAAMNSANDPAAMEKAADDFTAKFPKSELAPILYRTAMHGYQNANNAEKMEQMGRKTLTFDPNDPEALLGVAEVVVERTQESDLDRDQKLDEAAKLAQHATETAETDISIPAGTPQEKVDAYKNFLRSSAYAVLGTVAFNQQKFPDAQGFFEKSIQTFPAQPDPVVVLRLALALDRQNKYPEALKQANRAVELTQDSSPAGKLARQERDRLTQLTGASAAPAGAAPAGTAPGTPATPPAGTTPNPH
ncbi:MAG: hypothetical protein H0X25_15470 [Acidobacteriales bacterium]|nr:hypothetical protein [Terriglobales bacterium]